MADSEGMVFDIQRFSIHDGPGIRTTVFLKGCPLRCRWCHNPEGIPPEPMLSFTPSRCVGCGRCLEACPRKAHQNRGGEHTLDRSLCQVCGRCAEACCSGALEIVGKRMSVEEVLREVLSDRAFYETSGGGMTLSGGEPLLQGDFCEALLGEAKRQGLHCCVETSGLATWELIDRLRPLVDLWLYDLKETDAQQHRDAHPDQLALEEVMRIAIDTGGPHGAGGGDKNQTHTCQCRNTGNERNQYFAHDGPPIGTNPGSNQHRGRFRHLHAGASGDRNHGVVAATGIFNTCPGCSSVEVRLLSDFNSLAVTFQRIATA